MPNNLQEALLMELDNFQIKNENEQKIYLRHLISKAYYDAGYEIRELPILSSYVCNKDSAIIENELRSITYMGENRLGLKNLFDACAEEQFNIYKERSLVNNNGGNRINYLYNEILNQIRNINVNDNLKNDIINAFNKGDFYELYRFVDNNLLEEYINLSQDSKNITM